MRDLLELQTGQVAFLSGLLSGFSMTAAMHIMRHGMHTFIAHIVFYISVLSSLLFLVALYVDVRLTIELAGKTEIPEAVFERVSLIRFIGTTSATIALCLFVVLVAAKLVIARTKLIPPPQQTTDRECSRKKANATGNRFFPVR